MKWKCWENKTMEVKLLEDKSNRKKMNVTNAETCLNWLEYYTKSGEIVWNDYSKYEKGYELYTWRHDEAKWAVFLYTYYNDKEDPEKEVIKLLLNIEDQYFVFGKEYEQELYFLYNNMTTIQDVENGYIDTTSKEVDDGKPFEFTVNVNYDFETLGT